MKSSLQTDREFLCFLDLILPLLVPFLTYNRIHYFQRRHIPMADLIYLGLTILFFALTYGFIIVCERLMEENK